MAGAIPVAYGSLILAAIGTYLLLFCETHDLFCEIINVSEKQMKNCIVKIVENVFKNTEVG